MSDYVYQDSHYGKKRPKPTFLTTNLFYLVLSIQKSVPFWPFGIFLAVFFFIKYLPLLLLVGFGYVWTWPVVSVGIFSAGFTLFIGIFSFMLLKNITKYGEGLRVYKDTCNEVVTFSSSMVTETNDIRLRMKVNKLFCAYLTGIKLALRGEEIKVGKLDINEEIKRRIIGYGRIRGFFVGKPENFSKIPIEDFDSLSVIKTMKQQTSKNDIILEIIFAILKNLLKSEVIKKGYYPLGHHLISHVHTVNSNLTKMMHNMQSKVPRQLETVVVISLLVFVLPIIQLVQGFNLPIAFGLSLFLYVIFWGTFAVARVFETPFVNPRKNKYVGELTTVSDITNSTIAAAVIHTYSGTGIMQNCIC